jgi:hypothetical protein
MTSKIVDQNGGDGGEGSELCTDLGIDRFGANPEWKRAASCRPIRCWPQDGARVASQQSPILRPGQRHCSGQKNNVSPERRHDEPRVGRLFDLSCHARNLRSLPVGPTRVGPWMRRSRPATAEVKLHDALNGVALPVRNSHQINPHLPYRYQAELLTVIVSGTSRRNVLGAIAN